MLHPPGSGVPVPGARPGSMTSISMLRYTGVSRPTCSRIWRAIASAPMSSISSVAKRIQPCESSSSLSPGPERRVRKPAWTDLVSAIRDSLCASQNIVPCVKKDCWEGSSGSIQALGYLAGCQVSRWASKWTTATGPWILLRARRVGRAMLWSPPRVSSLGMWR